MYIKDENFKNNKEIIFKNLMENFKVEIFKKPKIKLKDNDFNRTKTLGKRQYANNLKDLAIKEIEKIDKNQFDFEAFCFFASFFTKNKIEIDNEANIKVKVHDGLEKRRIIMLLLKYYNKAIKQVL